MKILSKIVLMAMACEVFGKNPTVDKVYAREDGNIFFSENYALLDAGKLKIYPFDRDEILTTEAAKDSTVVGATIEEVDVDTTNKQFATAANFKVDKSNIEQCKAFAAAHGFQFSKEELNVTAMRNELKAWFKLEAPKATETVEAKADVTAPKADATIEHTSATAAGATTDQTTGKTGTNPENRTTN